MVKPYSANWCEEPIPILSSIGVYPVGDANAVALITRSLTETDLKIAAVRDGDTVDLPRENIFKLPGISAPERELFTSETVREYIQQEYGINLNDFMAGLVGVDHHEWIRRLGTRVNQHEDALLSEMAKSYARGLSENTMSALVDQLKDAAGRV